MNDLENLMMIIFGLIFVMWIFNITVEPTARFLIGFIAITIVIYNWITCKSPEELELEKERARGKK